MEVASGSDEEGKGHGRMNGLGVSVEGNGAAGAGKEELRLRSRSRGRGVGGVVSLPPFLSRFVPSFVASLADSFFFLLRFSRLQSTEEIEMQPNQTHRHSPSPNRHASPRARRLSELKPGASNEPKED